MAKYKMNISIVIVEDAKVESYGIQCEEEGKVIESIEDVSTDKDFVLDTVDKFNKNHLSPKHFKDAVEDAII